MNTEQRVVGILEDLSGNTDIKESDRLFEELALDSLNMVTLLLIIEDEFNIALNESDMNPFDMKTVADVITLVNKYTGTKNEKS